MGFVLNSIYVVLSPSHNPDEQAVLLVLQPTFALIHAALFVGIRRRTAWGFWATVGLLSLAGMLSALAVLLAFLEPDNRTFAGSVVGAVAGTVMAAFWLTPVLLLARARAVISPLRLPTNVAFDASLGGLRPRMPIA